MRRGFHAAGLAAFLLAPASGSANGTAVPDSLSFHVAPADPDTFWMNATFGFLRTTDGGQSWAWTCHEAILGSAPFSPKTFASGDGTLFATTPLLLAVEPSRTLWRTADGCDWTSTPTLDAVSVLAVAPRPNGDRVLAAGLNTSGTTAFLWISDDGGLSFGSPVLTGPGEIFTGAAFAPSDPQRAYLASLAPSVPAATLYRSDDAGDSWTAQPFPFVDQPSIHVVAVSPSDADVVWVRNDAATDRLFVTTNGGASFREELTAPADFSGFALLDGGDTRYAAIRAAGGMWRSTASAPAWTPVPGAPSTRCLAAENGVLYLCADPLVDPFVAAARYDGAVFDTAMAFQRITGPLVCPAGSDSASVCDPLWPALQVRLGLATPTDSPPPAADGPGGGCACSTATAAPGVFGAALVCLLGLASLAFRRR